MKLEFDPVKSAENDRKRGLPFELVASLEWSAALIEPDARQNYGEDRFVGYAPDESGRVHMVCFTMRGEVLRVISFRKANDREWTRWQKHLRNLESL